MFSFFHKKKHSPGDSPEDTSLSSNSRPEDDYILVNNGNGGGNGQPSNSLYPAINSGGPSLPFSTPYPPGGAAAPNLPKKEVSFLQGVPFSLCKELSTSGDSELISIQISEIMAYMTGKLQVETMDYDFSVERSVLLENCS